MLHLRAVHVPHASLINPHMPRYLPPLTALALLAACSGGAGGLCGPAGLDAGDCARLQTLQLPATLPAARGNPYADNLQAAQLGFQVFFDARFSSTQNMRCATCHQPEIEFQDGLPLPAANGFLGRRTPSTANAALFGWQFWDGRADSLWSQPLYPFENPLEMSYTRLEVAHRLAQLYSSDYAAIFGAMPDISDMSRFPAAGAPGMPAWDGMAAADQDTINRIFANLGKSIEAYLRKQCMGGSRVDRYLSGAADALTATELRGAGVFVRAGCIDCHSGPALSDSRYHVLGVPDLPGHPSDTGRASGLATLLASPFNAKGPYFDGPPPAGEDDLYAQSDADIGAFRTPSLRNLTGRAPYGHNGQFAALEDVVAFHLQGGGAGQGNHSGAIDPLLQPRTLSGGDQAALIAFLHALDGAQAPLPWSEWPQH